MRARLLKPGFFSDPVLSQMPAEAQLLFAGLWCMADREGRLLDAPRMIAGTIFPFRDISPVDIDTWLSTLAEHGYIKRYSAGGGRYVQICNFLKHQKVHPREMPSTIPPPPDGTQQVSLRNDEHEQDGYTQDAPKARLRRAKGAPKAEAEYEAEADTSGVSVTPNTPLTPHDGAPPLEPVENSVEILPEPRRASQAPGAESPPLAQTETTGRKESSAPAKDQSSACGSPPPKQNRPGMYSGSAAREAAGAAGVAVDAPRGSLHGAGYGSSASIALGPNVRKISNTDAGLQRVGDFAVEVTRRMLRDWMERHADRLPPPDDDICRRLLQAHQMSLDRLRDWLLELRRRGKRPESVQSWGWFAHLADIASRDGPVRRAAGA